MESLHMPKVLNALSDQVLSHWSPTRKSSHAGIDRVMKKAWGGGGWPNRMKMWSSMGCDLKSCCNESATNLWGGQFSMSDGWGADHTSQFKTPSVGIFGCNTVKSGGATSIFEHSPQQLHGWNRTESLVWSGHESSVQDWSPHMSFILKGP